MLRRALIALAAWLALCAPSLAAIAATNIGTGSDSASNATAKITGVTVSTSNYVVLVGVQEGSTNSTCGSTSLSDGTNTYTLLATQNVGSPNRSSSCVYYHFYSGAISSVTLTYTKNTAADSTVLSAFYATGTATSSFIDTGATNTASNTSSASAEVTTSASTANANELVVGLVGWTGNATFSQTSGFATPFTSIFIGSGGSEAQAAGGNKTQVSSASVTYGAASNLSSSTGWTAIIFALVPAGAAATACQRTLMGVGC